MGSDARVRLLIVSDSVLLQGLNGNLSDMPVINVGDLLPGDARITNARMGSWPGTVVFTIWSSSFTEVSEGGKIPEIKPEMRRI